MSSDFHSADPLLPELPEASDPRRGFLKQAAAILAGGIVGLVPAAVGIATFLNPLRSNVKREQRPAGSDADGFYLVAPLDSLSETPQVFKIIADRKDAWNTFPKEAIGAVYLQRVGSNEVRALNVSCPHLGCAVGYRSAQKGYFCPCHKSVFSLEGTRSAGSPSPRDLDTLDVKIENGQVFVKYQDFRAGIEVKKPV